jgi:MFS transporter, FSR family, fosmidomycin resistance protein
MGESDRLRYKAQPMTAITADTPRATDTRIITLVSAAHFVSHYYILILPPLFLLIRAEFGVSYVELGIALTAFNVISAVMQTPAGFLVDRVSARAVLVGGLALGAAALAVASLSPSFWLFVAMFAVLGLANTVYHPADYALLSHRVSTARMSKAYSIHTFSGILGSAIAPATLLFLADRFGWRGAFLGAALLGFAVAALLMVMGDVLAGRDEPAAKPKAEEKPAETSRSLLLSTPILLNLVFFFMLSLSNGGVQNYAVVALESLRGTSLTVGNLALSLYLLASALGVLIGGYAASRTARHDGIVVAMLTGNAVAVLGLAVFDLAPLVLMLVMGAAGLFQGIAMPSRDMLVRAVTPPGSFGKVFGFVTTGFNIAGMVAPLIFGLMMDQGHPQAVFFASALFALATIPTVLGVTRR